MSEKKRSQLPIALAAAGACVAVSGGVVLFSPQIAEGAQNACHALEKKGFANADYFEGNSLAQLIAQGISYAAPGALAEWAVRDAYPGWPPQVICALRYHQI